MGIVRRSAFAAAALMALVPASAQAIIAGSTASSAGSTVQVLKTTSTGIRASCTGSLISASVVLTAAHCVENAVGVQVVTGRVNLNNRTVGDDFAGIHWAVSPERSPDNHDLAYVDLGRESSSPVATPVSVIPAPGTFVRLRGYGQIVAGGPGSPLLQEGDAQVAACPSGTDPLVFCSRITAGFPLGPCHGDSGGPVLTAAGGLVGVSSAVNGPMCNGYSAYAPVANDAALIAAARAPRVTGHVFAAATTLQKIAAGLPPDDARAAGAIPSLVRVLRPGDGGVVAAATPDRNGAFQVVVPAGTYTVQTQATGYRTLVTEGFVVDRPRVFDAGLSAVAAPIIVRPKAKVGSVTRRSDGRLAVRVTASPGSAGPVRLSISGSIPATKRSGRYALGTRSATVSVRRTVTVLLRASTRAGRAHAKVGGRVRIVVAAGGTRLTAKDVRISRS
jgi:Trypsin